MTTNKSFSQRLDQFGRQHPCLMWLANGMLMVFVTLVLITTTEAPIVLYQAF
jgi:hypothetical protein